MVWTEAYTYQDDLEEHLLVDLHKLLVPLVNIGGLLAVVRVLVVSRRGVVAMVLTPLDDLAEYGLVDLGDTVNI